jgi:broad specificity phosphatase PhoE
VSVKVILARHGASVAYEKIDEEGDIFRQKNSTPLSQLGITQAQQLGKQVSIFRPDVLACSPQKRARKTAEIVTEYNPLFSNVIEDLREIRRVVDGQSIYNQLNLDYKRWRGEIIRRADLTAKFHTSDESHGEFLARQTRVKHWISQEFDGQTIIIVGHSQAHAMLLSSMILGDHPKPRELFGLFNRLFMSHGAITIVTYDYRKGWQMKEENFNITKHLK